MGKYTDIVTEPTGMSKLLGKLELAHRVGDAARVARLHRRARRWIKRAKVSNRLVSKLKTKLKKSRKRGEITRCTTLLIRIVKAVSFALATEEMVKTGEVVQMEGVPLEAISEIISTPQRIKSAPPPTTTTSTMTSLSAIPSCKQEAADEESVTYEEVPLEHGGFKRRRVGAKRGGWRYLCEHRVEKSKCKTCGGASLCEHNRERSQCREGCGGASICDHGRQRSQCRQCGGVSICEHGRQRSQCKACGGVTATLSLT